MKPDECYRPATRACWPDLLGYSARDLGPGSPGLVERPQRPGRPVHVIRGRRPRFPPVCRGIGACERESQRTARSRRRQWAAGMGKPGAMVRRAPGTARTIEPGGRRDHRPTREVSPSGVAASPSGGSRYACPMTPYPAPGIVARRLFAVLAALVVLVGVAACGASTPVASFDPASACTTDGRCPARTRTSRRCCRRRTGHRAATVDSGRNCTAGRARDLPSRGRRRGPVRRGDVGARRDERAHGRRVHGRGARRRQAMSTSTRTVPGRRAGRRSSSPTDTTVAGTPRSASTSSAATARARPSSPGRPRSRPRS